MNRRKLRFKYSLGAMLILGIVLSLLLTAGNVYADDGQTPQDPVAVPAEEESVVSGDEAAGEEVGGSESPLDENELSLPEGPPEGSIEEDDVSSEDLNEDPQPEEDTGSADEPGSVDSEDGEISEDITANTASDLVENEITMVDGDGEILDMASEATIDAVSSADPWWMVGSVKYAYIKTGGTCPTDTTPGVNCFESGTPISAALTYMDNNNLVPSDGILHIEPDSYTDSIYIDGSAGNGYLSKLKGLVSEGSSEDTELNGSVQVSNTMYGFTLSGFTINNYVTFDNNSGTLTLSDLDVNSTTSSGIYITNQNGAVKVDNVKSNNNKGYGMYVDNRAGVQSVTVTNSEFSHNEDSVFGNFHEGLRIFTNGDITLNGVSACDNDGIGAQFSSNKGATIKNGVFNNNHSDPGYGNSGYGLKGSTTNNLTLENVQADGNTNFGIEIFASGSVILNNVCAYSNGIGTNFYSGVYIRNTSGTGTVTVNKGSYVENGGEGLEIYSHNNVSLNGITSLGNSQNGVYVDNCDLSSGVCLGTGSVTISGKLPNLFNENGYSGLYVLSGGAVSVSYFQADNNSHTGIYIENDYTGRSGNVTLNLSYVPPVGNWMNSASGNSHYGLYVESFGNILIDKCIADDDNAGGAILTNADAASAKSVTIKNSTLSSSAGGSGLKITSKGNVILTDVHANQNSHGYGVDINNSTGTGNISITGTKSTICDFSHNGLMGLRLYSAGTITLKNIMATNNANGAFLWNLNGVGKSVNVTNADFSNNADYGLQVSSNGAVIMSSVISCGNVNGGGLSIENTSGSRPQIVKITNGQFNDNPNSNGIQIISLGTVTLNSVQANGNGSEGASLDTCVYTSGLMGCKGSGGVTILGADNQFNANGGTGLSISSRGSVSMNNVTADDNGSSGLYLWHSNSNCTGNINLKASRGAVNSFSNNGMYGIYIESLGNITLQNFKAINNENFGAYISNQNAPAARKVTISYALINDNQNIGLTIQSTGAVTLTAVQVLRSSKHFWEIDNDNGQIVNDRLPYDQAYDEIWWFDGSSGDSLTVDLTSLTFDAYLELFDENWYLLDSDDNGGGGNDAQITYSLSADGIYYLRVSSVNQGEYGNYTMTVAGTSPGTYYYNHKGVTIDNRYNSGTGNVTITAPSSTYGLDCRDNNSDGLSIYSNGVISLAGVEVSYNGGYYGAVIHNDGLDGKAVILKNCNFDNNDSIGLELVSKGNITWTGGGANGNLDWQGAFLSNAGAAAYRPVNISKASFDDNSGYGVSVTSLGAITLTNVGASRNTGASGVSLDNCQYDGGIPGCKGYGNVTIGGTFGQVNFNDNDTYGLNVASRGNILLTNVNAAGNLGGQGAILQNSYENAYGNITMKTSSKNSISDLSNNDGTGLVIGSNGAISVSNVTATNNGSNGLEISNNGAASAKKVTLMRIMTDDNNNYGIWVSSVGAIALSYIEDYGNTGAGIGLYNWSASTPQSVSVSRAKIDGNATGHGLSIDSKGDITLNNVVSTNNNYGAYLNNNWGTSSKVTLLGSMGDNVFSDNVVDGLYIISNGNISLASVTAESNSQQGINLQTGGTLTASKIWLSRNLNHGMSAVASLGATITEMQSYNNGSTGNGDGLFLQMNTGSLAKITRSVFMGNYGNGIDLAGDSNPLLTGTLYFGNDADNNGDKNLLIH